MSNRGDLASRADIERLVDTFYDRVGADDLLGPIFNDVAKVDWSRHLPTMYAFWEGILFGTGGYKGNPLETHRTLARLTPLTPREFDRWLALFHQCVDELFAGPVAADAKRRAANIAATLQYHAGTARA